MVQFPPQPNLGKSLFRSLFQVVNVLLLFFTVNLIFQINSMDLIYTVNVVHFYSMLYAVSEPDRQIGREEKRPSTEGCAVETGCAVDS
jgi:hypothetical protein